MKLLYKRFEEKGRQLPPGVHYVNSRIDKDIKTCYQAMENDIEKGDASEGVSGNFINCQRLCARKII